jgi:hypothetical protein
LHGKAGGFLSPSLVFVAKMLAYFMPDLLTCCFYCNTAIFIAYLWVYKLQFEMQFAMQNNKNYQNANRYISIVYL